jgi:catechol 2,3-dioxygenase-like lactoylglutathione lyase family enzyme
VLAVPNLLVSAAYYRDQLGFEVIEIDDPGWRFARRGRCYLMLGECPEAMPVAQLGDHANCMYWEVDDIDALYAEWVSRGAQPKAAPQDKPWGMREFALRTIDGHGITVGQALP